MIASRDVTLPTAWARGAIGATVVLVAAELLTRADLVNRQYLPPATLILARTGELLATGDFLGDVWVTLKACLIGLALATVIAVPVGLLLGASDLAYRAASVLIELVRPIPSVALIPLAIPIFGRGHEMKVALVLFACAWPLLFNTIYGMRQIDPVSVETARVYGLGRIKIAARVHLRSASPFVFTGFKIAVGIAVILAVSCELIAGGSEGIGIRMSAAAAAGDQRTVYAVTIVAGLLGLALVALLGIAERRLFAWARVERES